MAEHVRAGQARRLTSPAGRRRFLMNAALLDDVWYAVMDGDTVYRRVSDAFAALLTVLDAVPGATETLQAPGDGAAALAVGPSRNVHAR